MKKNPGISQNLFYFLILSVLFAVFFWPLFSLKNGLLNGDYGAQVYPWLSYYAEALKRGFLPLWTDKIQCGFPLFAEGQTAMLYLPQLTLFWFLPFKAAYNLLFIGHYVLSGAFFYLFCRVNKISTTASLFAVMVYLFSAASAGGYYGIFSLRPLLWFPLSLFCADKILQKKSKLFLCLLVFSQSQMWVAGYPQMALYATFFTVVYYGFKAYPEGLCLRDAALFLSALLAGGLIALPQILPTLELAEHSTRVLQDKSLALSGSFAPWAFAAMWVYRAGGLFNSNLYLGAFPFLLALSGFSAKGSRRWYLLCGIALFLALGQWNPVLRALPSGGVLSLFRMPSKFMFFFMFFLIAAAAVNWDRQFTADEGKPQKRFLKTNITLLSLILAVFLSVSLMVAAAGKYFVDFGNWYVRNFVAGKSFHHKTVEEYFAGVRSIHEALAAQFALNSSSFWIPWGFGAAALAVFYGAVQNKKRRPLFLGLLFMVLAADLWVYGVATPGTSWVGNVGAYKSLPDSSRYASDGRWLEISPGGNEDLLSPNGNMAAAVAQAGAYSPLLEKNYYLLAKDFAPLDDSFGRSVFRVEEVKAAKPLIDFMGIKYVVARRGFMPWEGLIRQPGMEAEMEVYQNPAAMTECNLVYGAKVILGEAQRIKYLRSGEFKPADEVILSEVSESFGGTTSTSLRSQPIDPAGLWPEQKKLKVEAASAGFLVWNQTWDPGWSARIDGHRTGVYHANQAFMAVRLEPGFHEVLWSYAPKFFMPGMMMYIAGVVLSFGGAVYFGFAKRG